MKKQLVLSLLTLATAHLSTAMDSINPELLLNFSKKVNLSSDEMNAGINLYNNLPSQEKPFDLKIESKENQICYDLKNGSNAVTNCIEKKRLAELLIAWIQVCIEKNLQEELKKAENMLYNILKSSQGESLSININQKDINNFNASLILDSHQVKYKNNVAYESGNLTQKSNIQTDNNTVNFSASITPTNLELSLDAKDLKNETDLSANIKGTKEFNNINSLSVKTEGKTSYNSPVTGEINGSFNNKQSGPAYAPTHETEVNIKTEKHDLSAEFTRDDDSLSLNSLNIRNKKAKQN